MAAPLRPERRWEAEFRLKRALELEFAGTSIHRRYKQVPKSFGPASFCRNSSRAAGTLRYDLGQEKLPGPVPQKGQYSVPKMAEEDNWKPNGRPQSTIARSFSAALNEAFMIDNSLDGLSKAVEQKKKAVSSQSQELEALEARLRETEERLKQTRSRNSSPSSPGNGRNTAHRRPPVGRAFSGQGGEVEQAVATSPLATQPPSTQSRPPTAESPSYSIPRIPGVMLQPSEKNVSSDYVLVDRTDGTQRQENVNAARFDGRKSENIAPHPTRRAPPKPIE